MNPIKPAISMLYNKNKIKYKQQTTTWLLSRCLEDMTVQKQFEKK